MSLTAPDRDRIRWHCRRGMLELDLVLTAFLERHLDALAPPQVDTLRALLERPDPELLDLVMGHSDAAEAAELELIALMRAVAVCDTRRDSLTPDPSPEGRREVRGATGHAPVARH